MLPEWLAKPTVVSVDLKHLEVPIDGIPELDDALVNKLKNKGCTHFFPGNYVYFNLILRISLKKKYFTVQNQLVPWLIKTQKHWDERWLRDVCVSAPTGSGKTLSYVLPIIQVRCHSSNYS